MSKLDDLASIFSGRTRAESNSVLNDATTHTYIAEALSDSEDGAVTIALSQDVTLPDDAEGIGVEVPTTVAVKEGDEVIVTVYGGTPLRSPVVTGNNGGGDRMQAQIDNAETLAQQAEAVATATGQHFWHDASGAHVTEVEREDWEDSTSPDYHAGPNSLWNSLGMLFRDGPNNLLALVAGSTPGVAIYDGQGNDAENILAEFTADAVRIGGNVAENDSGGATVQFFDQTETHDTSMDAFLSVEENDSIPGFPMYDERSSVDITSKLTDAGRVVDTGSEGTAALSLEQELSYGVTDNNEQFSEVHASLVADSTYDSSALYPTTSHARVSATATTGGMAGDVSGLSYVELIADALGVGEGEGYITYVTSPQAVAALLQPGATFSGGNTTYTATANGWIKSTMNTVHASTGNWGDYFTFTGGVITALKPCMLEVSIAGYWNSGAVGQYGVGLFKGSSTVGSGTETSIFNYKASASGQFSVVMPPRLFQFAQSEQAVIGRYAISGSAYRDGTNMSCCTIKVIQDRS